MKKRINKGSKTKVKNQNNQQFLVDSQEKEDINKQEPIFHVRNKYQGFYDYAILLKKHPQLEEYVILNKKGQQSIDYFNPQAIKELNSALLKHYYDLSYWDIPDGFLCPPIPGRAEYIHYIADIIKSMNRGKKPLGKNLQILDVGVGANCIYPVIGIHEYGWNFIGSDVNHKALESASRIIEKNPSMKNKLSLRHQNKVDQVLKGIVRDDEFIDIVICNPPFFGSAESAQKANAKKNKNLKNGNKKSIRNFRGQASELWCNGGELQFIKTFITESKAFSDQICWNTSLVSRKESLPAIYQVMEEMKVEEVKTIEIEFGNKLTRFVAWSYLNTKQQKAWAEFRW